MTARNRGRTLEFVERKVGYVTFILLRRTGSLILSIVLRTAWSLGTNSSSPPIVVTIMAEKPPVATTELIVRTVGSAVVNVYSLSTVVL